MEVGSIKKIMVDQMAYRFLSTAGSIFKQTYDWGFWVGYTISISLSKNSDGIP